MPVSIGAATTVKPVFGSSFIQSWYAQNWDQNRWVQEFTMLQKAGISEIIIQTIADTKAKSATYPTQMRGYTSNGLDMVGTALSAGDTVEMKVRLGLGFNSDWWTKNASDVTWLNSEAAANQALISEIVTKYGNHASLTGWYISYEFSQLTARTSTQQTNLNNFLKQISGEIKQRKPLDIMIAPFYNSQYYLLSSLYIWPGMLQNILMGTGITIVALQDCVGVGYNSTSQLARIFAYTKQGTDALGMTLYADVETFTSTPTSNISAPLSRVIRQLANENPYVKGYVAFSFNHYQNANEPSQLYNYNDYYNYYLNKSR